MISSFPIAEHSKMVQTVPKGKEKGHAKLTMITAATASTYQYIKTPLIPKQNVENVVKTIPRATILCTEETVTTMARKGISLVCVED